MEVEGETYVTGEILITVQPEENPEPNFIGETTEAVEPNFSIENPLHVSDNIPIAHLIRVEVEGQAILDPKIMPIYNCLIKAWDYIQITSAVIMIIGIWGGIITFLLWIYNPYIFGMPNDDNY